MALQRVSVYVVGGPDKDNSESEARSRSFSVSVDGKANDEDQYNREVTRLVINGLKSWAQGQDSEQ